MTRIAVCAAFALLSVASPSFAAPVDNSAKQVAALIQLISVSPRDGGIYVELAGEYMRVGRVADAMTAYRRVLSLDNVMLETSTGNAIWSHEVARRALATTSSFTSL